MYLKKRSFSQYFWFPGSGGWEAKVCLILEMGQLLPVTVNQTHNSQKKNNCFAIIRIFHFVKADLSKCGWVSVLLNTTLFSVVDLLVLNGRLSTRVISVS